MKSLVISDYGERKSQEENLSASKRTIVYVSLKYVYTDFCVLYLLEDFGLAASIQTLSDLWLYKDALRVLKSKSENVFRDLLTVSLLLLLLAVGSLVSKSIKEY